MTVVVGKEGQYMNDGETMIIIKCPLRGVRYIKKIDSDV